MAKPARDAKDLIPGVGVALALAEKAAQCEKQRHMDQAYFLYERVIEHLEARVAELPAGGPEHKAVLGLIATYRMRAQELQRQARDIIAEKIGSGAPRRRRQSHQPWIYNRQDGTGEVSWADDAPEPEPRPESRERRAYWRMRLIRRSMRHGARVSPRIYVPKEIWVQVGYKAAGLHAKEDAMSKVHYALARHIHKYDAPTSADAASRALTELRLVRTELCTIQDRLHGQFAFIPQCARPEEEEDGQGTAEAKRGSWQRPRPGGAKSSPPATAGPDRGTTFSGRFRDAIGAAYSMGINVAAGAANAAMTTRERLGAAVPVQTTEQQLLQYKDFVCNLCDTAQTLDEWWVVCEVRLLENEHGVAAQDPFAPRREDGSDVAVLRQIMAELSSIAAFMDSVILELVLRDMNALLKRYILKMRKSFARMYFDEAPGEGDLDAGRNRNVSVEAW